MKPEYVPKTLATQLGYLVEECGEVLHAVGKTQRWGFFSTDPTSPLPEAERETNAEWISREIGDLKYAIFLVERALRHILSEGMPQGAHQELSESPRGAQTPMDVTKDAPEALPGPAMGPYVPCGSLKDGDSAPCVLHRHHEDDHLTLRELIAVSWARRQLIVELREALANANTRNRNRF